MTPEQMLALRITDKFSFNLKVYGTAYCISLTDIADPRSPQSLALLEECVRAYLDGRQFYLPDLPPIDAGEPEART
jgi:hypothetical protein